MFTLSTLKPKFPKRNRKRVGRGLGSGHGAYSGRGIKGQKARKSGGHKAGFEGGRMPLVRQMPKQKGFRSFFPKNQVVSLSQIEKVFQSGDRITPKSLRETGLVDRLDQPIKILGKGKIMKSFNFDKNLKLSVGAQKAVLDAGGKVETVQN